MLYNFIITALRNLRREKTYSIINIIGLSIGLTCFVLFYFSWQYENSFDKFHTNAENIYQVKGKQLFTGKTTDLAHFDRQAAVTLASEVPEIQAGAAINFEPEVQIIIGTHKFKEDVIVADENIFKIFTIPVIKAQSSNTLNNPQAVLLSESVAKAYFGTVDPLGKPIVMRLHFGDSSEDQQFYVAGIIKNSPSASSYKMDIICSSERYMDAPAEVFVLLKKDASFANAKNKVKEVMNTKYTANPDRSILSDKFELSKFTDTHLSDPAITKYLAIFGIVAFVVLLLSCVNYINLSISMSIKRIKEIGVRKTLGSGRINLMCQFLSESFITNILALLLAIIIIYALVSVLPADIIRPLKISEIGTIQLVAGLAGIIILVSLVSGVYPAFYVSRLNPALIFSNSKVKGQKKFTLRKSLIFFQFAVLIILLVLTTGISNQLNFIEKSKTGFDKENIVFINAFDMSLLMDSRTEELKSKMLENPHIKNVACLNGHPAQYAFETQVSIPGSDYKDKWSNVLAGKGFLNTFSIPLVEGRDLDASDNIRDVPRKVLINEEAAKALGKGSAIGKIFNEVSVYGNGKKPVQVVGVFKNFTQQTLHYAIKPMLISKLPNFGTVTAVKIDGQDVQTTLNHIKKTWESFFPLVQTNYTFFDETLQKLYLSEYRLGSMSKIFAALSIIIAVMGIFGLTAFSTEQRKKEIAIRKVLGANFNKLVGTFFKEINLPAVIANIVSVPIGIYLINKWLEEFAFKASMPFTYYILVIVTSLLLAFLTVGVQVFRVARLNPVDSLRSE